MKTLGLIGYPLGHSFSRKYFTEKFEREKISGYIYKNFPLETIHELTKLLETETSLIGLNVTIPYKQQVMEYLNELDETAKEIGAVNTIKVIQIQGKPYLKGYNTDSTGFKNSLMPLLESQHKKALVLGTGGASKAIIYVLKTFGIKYTYVSRTPKDNSILSYQDLDKAIIEENTLIINTSPLGMHPDVDTCPAIPYECVTDKHLLYDLVYNPEVTLFMKKGQERGAIVQNGLPMLVGQAEAAWEIWNR